MFTAATQAIFNKVESRRRRFLLYGPQKPMTRCCRYQIQADNSPPGKPSGEFLSRLNARDSTAEVVYDPLTLGWHLYCRGRKGSSPPTDLLFLQPIEFRGRKPGDWLLQEMDRLDRWAHFGGPRGSAAAHEQDERDAEYKRDKLDREWSEGAAGEGVYAMECASRKSIIVP